jgi:hypothetical protein
LAATFALAAAGKLFDMPGTRSALTQFGVPKDVAAPASYLLPLTELAVAVFLIPSPTGRASAVGALALLVLFALAVGLAGDDHRVLWLHRSALQDRTEEGAVQPDRQRTAGC